MKSFLTYLTIAIYVIVIINITLAIFKYYHPEAKKYYEVMTVILYNLLLVYFSASTYPKNK